ncbi:MAG: DUF1178 family protein [Desulfatitalea sp.]|nr:DUF1178 family protein [Desulfatitalea sp.]MBI5896201.1 DUF1178 family protein [Desulfobacterales bacterium]
MIAYDLQCPNSHRFEGWFEDSKAFERQQRQGLIACPVCGHTDVARLPSTFAIKGVKHSAALPAQPRPPSEQEIMARAIMHYVQNHFDNVGTDFAKEALKIHYGVVEPHNIRGVSSPREEETLRQEGVTFFKFPAPSSSDSEPPSSESDV